jgi:hypothetical protein
VSIEVMKQALEALETPIHEQPFGLTQAAITALRTAIAEAEKQESYWQEEARRYAGNADFWREKAKRQPLTEEEIRDIWDGQLFHITDMSLAIDFVRDIEAAHGIGGKP